MATSVFPATGGIVDNTSAAAFIPEIWSDEVIAAYKSNQVMANNVRTMSFTGKKGDTIHVPIPVRGAAIAKAENTAVTVQNNTDTKLSILIDQHFEYSRMIEDITGTQALESMRRFFTDDAGYALATNVDNALLNLGKSVGDGDASDWVHSGAFYSNAGTSISLNAADTVAAADDMTDLVIRGMLQKQDDADVPMTGRSWVIPPIAKNDLLGIERFSSQDFVNSKPVGTGNIGTLYGCDFYVSTNCAVTETAAANAGGSIDARQTMLFHKDSFILVEQTGVRSQTQYKQEWLSNLYTSDRLYGVKTYRPESAFVLVVAGA
jgi:N4-gp56 family major capsid protein|tara:strand:+ start:827 stop:1786 length:960 start_codon:yes stop_codon:yes gene_type:complete